jgi:hypothetical protein
VGFGYHDDSDRRQIESFFTRYTGTISRTYGYYTDLVEGLAVGFRACARSVGGGNAQAEFVFALVSDYTNINAGPDASVRLINLDIGSYTNLDKWRPDTLCQWALYHTDVFPPVDGVWVFDGFLTDEPCTILSAVMAVMQEAFLAEAFFPVTLPVFGYPISGMFFATDVQDLPSSVVVPSQDRPTTDWQYFLPAAPGPPTSRSSFSRSYSTGQGIWPCPGSLSDVLRNIVEFAAPV